MSTGERAKIKTIKPMREVLRKQENKYKDDLVREFRAALPHYVTFRHEDAWSSGHPDISTTGAGHTTWIEAKHATPGFESQGIQELTLRRLQNAGRAWYLIWHERSDGSEKRTLLVRPSDLKDLKPTAWCSGFDHRFVIEFIKAQERA